MTHSQSHSPPGQISWNFMVRYLQEIQLPRLTKPLKSRSSGQEKQFATGCNLFKCHAAVKYRGSALQLIPSEVTGAHRDCAAAGHVLPLCFDFVVL